MKKKMIMVLVCLLLLPIHVSADKIDLKSYNSKNLEETLKEENISADLSNYKENDKQISIYMFRGKGCSHCQEFLNYVANTLVSKYGDKFRLVSFEAWNDVNNSKLLNSVADFLGDQAGGVPYIVIGDKTFLGYGSSMNSEIESAITTLYNSKKRYDVFTEMNKKEKSDMSNLAVIVCNFLITTVGVILVIVHNNFVKKQLLEELEKKAPIKKETSKKKTKK